MWRTNTFKFCLILNNCGTVSQVLMDECEDTAAPYPDWIPFDGANERFMRTPANSRLPPPVILANRTIVFGRTDLKRKRTI